MTGACWNRYWDVDYVEYSLNSGSTWTVLGTLTQNAYTPQTLSFNISVPIPIPWKSSMPYRIPVTGHHL